MGDGWDPLNLISKVSAGRVRWQGQSWSAVNLKGGQPLPPGSWVTVMGRAGNKLQVMEPGGD